MKTGLRALWYIIWYPCRYLFAFTLFAQAVRIADTDPSGSGISVVLGLICLIPEIIKFISPCLQENYHGDNILTSINRSLKVLLKIVRKEKGSKAE